MNNEQRMPIVVLHVINWVEKWLLRARRTRVAGCGAPISDVERQLHMYDQLWEESPRIKQERARSRAEGKAEGELQMAQRMFVNIVSARYPSLTELAKQQAAQIDNPAALNKLARKVVIAPDEHAARQLL